MVYKTILVQAGPDRGAPDRIRLAARLARAGDAHLVGAAATGISRLLPAAMLAAGGAALARQCAVLREAARRALEDFGRIAAQEGVASVEARLVDDEAGAGLSLQARYCDLAVVGQAEHDVVRPPQPPDLPDYLVLAGGRPLLVVPFAGCAPDLGAEAVVGWDGSVEAMRALDGALPLLRTARHTSVLAYADQAPWPGDAAHPDLQLIAWLARHGVAARLDRRSGKRGGNELDDPARAVRPLARKHWIGGATMFKTILVHVDLSVHAPARMHYAAAVAALHGAQLVGAAMLGVSRVIFPHGYDERPGTLGASYFEPLAEHAWLALSHFEEIARRARVAHVSRFVSDQADDGLARLARFADLVVLSQDDPSESVPDMAVHLPEYVILNSARPVLVVPRSDPPPYVNRKVLVGWNGSKEAAFALHATLPLLRRSDEVHVAALGGPGLDEADLRAQQADLHRFLGQHRITPRLTLRFPQHAAQQDAGHALLALARELDCGTLVMGCYGHSRFRELCLGGASRTVLADADIAVLMAH